MAVVTEYREPSCDFCNAEHYEWVFPVDDFTQEMLPECVEKSFPVQMMGSWLACETCKKLIENNNREALVEHSLSSYNIKTESQVYPAVKRRVETLHEEFFFHLKGEAIQDSNIKVAEAITEVQL